MPDLHLPDTIAREIQGYRLHELTRRHAPSTVVMLSKPGRRSMVLKIGRHLVPEARRLQWLTGRLPVPNVVAIADQDGTDYLLMTRLPGRDGSAGSSGMARDSSDSWRTPSG